MNTRLTAIITLSLIITLFASSALGKKTVDSIAAVVGEDIILLSEVHARAQAALQELQRSSGQGGQMNGQIKRKDLVIKKTLDEIIDDTLVTQQAKEMKINVTTEEVDMAIENMARENNLDMETFARAIQAQGMLMPEYKQAMRRDILKYKVLNLRVRGRVKIGEDEAREFYNNQVRDVRESGYFVGAHILIRIPKDARAKEIAQLRGQMLALKGQIENGANFEALAKEHSQDSVTAPHGGSLGKRMPGEIPKLLDRTFLDLEPGEIAGPIRTNAGFHLLKLQEREDLGVKSFAAVKNRIINQLMQQEMVRQQKIWLSELKRKTFIDIRL